MSARYPVKWFSSTMQGAPDFPGGGSAAASNTPGKLTNLLKKVLITGFGMLPADTMSYSATDNEVTVTIGTGHGYLVDSIILVDGADDAAYNGEQRVTFISSTQLKYQPLNAPASNTATGTITIKNAPVGGWEILSETGGGEIMAFGSTNPNSGPVKLLIFNDAQAPYWNSTSVWARVLMVEDFVDINTYTEIKEMFWHGSSGKEANGWDFIADDRAFYFSNNAYIYQYNSCDMVAFGDICSVRPNDKYATMLVSSSASASETSALGDFSETSKCQLARAYHQIFGVIDFKLVGLFSKMGEGLALPNPADNGMYISPTPVPVLESGNILRGYLPGMIVTYNSNENLRFAHLKNSPAYPGKTLKFISVPTYYRGTKSLTAFDITGPWVRDNE